MNKNSNEIIILQMSRDDLKELIKEAIVEVMTISPEIHRDRLLSREEAATYMNVSMPTLNTWEKSGQLTPKRYGKRVYYFESDLLKRPR